MANVMSMVNDYDNVKKVADDFKPVYTPFHGCGHKLVPEAPTRLGIKHLLSVPEQMVIDGIFPTVVSPNPEIPGLLPRHSTSRQEERRRLHPRHRPRQRPRRYHGVQQAGRVRACHRQPDGRAAAPLSDRCDEARGQAARMPPRSRLSSRPRWRAPWRSANGLDCYDTFTGFKFMAEKMNELEGAGKNTVIFSYEESYGYMIGHYVRDKDAVTASLLLTEMAAWYYSQGMTLFDALNALFEKYGWYGEKTHNLVMPGLDGAEKMAALMKSLRETPPSEIAGVKVATYKDYSDGTRATPQAARSRRSRSRARTCCASSSATARTSSCARAAPSRRSRSTSSPRARMRKSATQTSPNTPPGSTPSPDIPQFYQSSRGRRGSRAALILF